MKYLLYTTVLIIISLKPIAAIDNPHFYRATNFFHQPRIEHDYLSSFDATIGGGSSTTSRNGHHKKVPLFDMYGPHLLTIDNIPISFSIDGKFSITESNLSYTQNLAHGLLVFFHIPVRRLTINNISFKGYNNENDSMLKKLITETLLANNIYTGQSTEVGVGDLTSLIGWTHNYQNTKTIDFIDGTIAMGLLAPTGKKRNEHQLFSLPTGYNGHWGFPITGSISFGAYEWITFGGYANALFFTKKTDCLPIKTTPEQTGIIKLGFGNAIVKKGTIWNTGLYCTADHFIYGLSLTGAYSYSGEQKSSLIQTNKTPYANSIINTDPMLKKWTMHTVTILMEYDFAQQNSAYGTRIGAFYNRQIGGTHVFNTSIGSGSFGVEIAWDL